MSGRLRDECLTGFGLAHDPRGDMDREPGHIVTSHVDITDVNPDTNTKSLIREVILDGVGRVQGTGRRGDEGEDSVASVLHNSPAVVAHALLDCPIMDIEKIAPLVVAFVDRALG